MRLGIDLRHVPADGSPGAGVSHASVELAETMERMGPEWGIECIPIRGEMRSWQLAQLIKKQNIQALFCASGAVPPFVSVPCFPWVHDVAIFKHPEWFSQSTLKRLITTKLFLHGVKRAKHVFAVSEDTKRTLMEISGLPSDKITVTYQGIRPIRPGETKPYALVLGSINPRKNISFIESMWPEIQKRVPHAELIVAGQPLMSFDDAQRDAYVRHATVVLLPSLHEGFGRTALEAMSAGVPVVASNRGAIPEVVGDAGLLLDPEDREAWIKGIVRAFEGGLDGGKGPEQAERFSWDKTAGIILAKLSEIR